MARNRSLFAALSRRGPHRILRGDLGFAGIGGLVYTPAGGFGLPAVAFGHDWLAGVQRYTGTLEHLASWGIVAAAPDTQRGLVPSVLDLSHDLSATLDVLRSVRLGSGDISVSPQKLGVAGHGFGGAAAVLTAGRANVRAAVAVFPSVTTPSAEVAAAGLRVPGLVLATPDDAVSLRTDAAEVAAAWDGAVLRVVQKATLSELVEKRGVAQLVGMPVPTVRTQRIIRAHLTGFLLFHLTGDKTYREFAAADAAFPRTTPPDPAATPPTDEERIIALFK